MGRVAGLGEGSVCPGAQGASVQRLACLAGGRPLWRRVWLIDGLVAAAVLACTGDA